MHQEHLQNISCFTTRLHILPRVNVHAHVPHLGMDRDSIHSFYHLFAQLVLKSQYDIMRGNELNASVFY